MIQLRFNVFPISTNKLYVNIPGQKRRFISTEGKKFKKLIEEEVKKTLVNTELLHYLSALEGKQLTLFIKIISPSWLLKDSKTIRKKDISSCEKALVDSVFDAFKISGLSLDDSQIWSLHLIKEYGPDDITLISICEYE